MIESIFSTGVNNIIGEHREEKARERNFYYNEQTAKNADKRTRELYRDLYSPKAQLEQLKQAGLSPSIYASGGMAGKSGVNGAQGAGANGISPNVYGIDPLAASQIRLNNANADNLHEDTTSKELENEVKKLTNSKFKSEFDFLQHFNNKTYWKNGVPISIYDVVKNADDYKQFKDALYTHLNDNSWTYINTPNGDEMLRKIYQSVKQFDNEVSVLENSQENAELMLKITKLLNNDDFANNTAEYKKQELSRVIEDAKLTTREREAFNNLLNKMGENTWSDILIVLLTFIAKNTSVSANLSQSHTESIVTKK